MELQLISVERKPNGLQNLTLSVVTALIGPFPSPSDPLSLFPVAFMFYSFSHPLPSCFFHLLFVSMSRVQFSLPSISLYIMYHETLDDRYLYKCRSYRRMQYFKVITCVKVGNSNGIETTCQMKLGHRAASSTSPLNLRLNSSLPNEMEYRIDGTPRVRCAWRQAGAYY